MPDHAVLAFDFGLRHIGVAVGQPITRTASPLTTIAAVHGQPDWAAITALLETWRPGVLLVGLPLNMDDTESDMSARARRFAAALQARAGIGVTMVDERLTTFEAERRARETSDSSHAIAAQLIAETWLRV